MAKQDVGKSFIETYQKLCNTDINILAKIISEFAEINNTDIEMQKIHLGKAVDVKKMLDKYKDSACKDLLELLFLLKKINEDIFLSQYRPIKIDDEHTKILITLNVKTMSKDQISTLDQYYETLIQNTPSKSNIVICKFDTYTDVANLSSSDSIKITLKHNKDTNKYTLHCYNLFDYNKFSTELMRLLGYYNFNEYISKVVIYSLQELKEFNMICREPEGIVMDDALPMQATPSEVFSYLFKTLQVKRCNVSGIPLSNFGKHHNGTTANAFII